MKKSFVLVFAVFIGLVYPQTKQSLLISFPDSSVTIHRGGNYTFPRFTPGNHHPDKSLIFTKTGNTFKALLPIFQRGLSSGRLASAVIYHISSGPVPTRLCRPLSVTVQIPKGKVLIWHGKIWHGRQATLKFPSYFVAREFPIILVPNDKYLVRTSDFNRIDNLTGVYVWEDSAGKSALTSAFQAVDSAAYAIGDLAPGYWHSHIENYNHSPYLLTVFITSERVLTGLEHYNSPYVVAPPQLIREDGVYHTLLHSLIGKALIPEAYTLTDGHYLPADILGLYEGLTTYLSERYVRQNFPAYLSALIYRAKLRPEWDDLRSISFDTEYESYYGKGYLFWIYLQSEGLNVDLFTRWLFSLRLSQTRFPVRVDWSKLVDWLSEYDKRIGRLAADCVSGSYIEKGFNALENNGWKPIPVWEVPYWYNFYIGPFAVKPGGLQLPTDQFSATDAFPLYLYYGGKRLLISPDSGNPALQLIKSHPDSSYEIEFSDGFMRRVPNKLRFLDGSPYFMQGTINIKGHEKFWEKLNFLLNK